MDFEKLENNLEYNFKDKNLLKKALTHKSYANEYKIESNEKLEFLGDSILSVVTSIYIYHNYSNKSEGKMSKVRASVVCGKNLSEIALKNNFDEFLFLGKSEKNVNNNILEDSVEAVIAAMYLDGGMEPVQNFIMKNLKEEIDIAMESNENSDYKTRLQEILQKNGQAEILYEIIKESGPDHDKHFVAQVSVNGEVLAQGEGRSKKEAQMQAAKRALEKI